MTTTEAPLIRLTEAGKRYGNIRRSRACRWTSTAGDGDLRPRRQRCRQVHPHQDHRGPAPVDEGTYEVEGEPVRFGSPRDALARASPPCYQDLAVVPLMPVWRNFFLGSEIRKGRGPPAGSTSTSCGDTTRIELANMGIDLPDVDQPIGTLSGGERQCVAIARAVYFGAKVLILDEPTAALGVKQAGVVLRYIVQARERGLGVIFITHNPHHAYPVGDRFLLLNRGRGIGYHAKGEISREELTGLMAGGAELEELSHELERTETDPEIRQVAAELEHEVAGLSDRSPEEEKA